MKQKCTYKKCEEKAITNKPQLCKKHYIDWFEKKVEDTIKKYSLIKKNEKIAVAASGGKDSTTILYILKKSGYNITAISIDEGIPGYRDTTLKDLEKFCKTQNIPLKIYSFKKDFGFQLQEKVEEKKTESPCKTCGILRRYLLNKYSFGYKKIVTGHNLDDEFQNIMMNLFKSNIEVLTRLGPKTGNKTHEGFVQRVKPLYFLTEKQVLIYTILKGFQIQYTECPNASLGYRHKIREFFLELEKNIPGLRQNSVENFLKIKTKFTKKETQPKKCKLCGKPSKKEICSACQTIKKMK